jgi:hypothetical protein
VNKYKTENKLYKAKAKELNKVTSEAEKIGENAEEKIYAQVEAKKAESKAMEKIRKAEAKLKCLMENPPEDCSQFQEPVEQKVSVAQAAPAPMATSTAEVPAMKTGAPFETIKLLPYAGGTSYNGEIEQLEAELAMGLRLESNITTRFSMGIGLNYAQLKTQDFANNRYNAGAYGPGYYQAYGMQGREIQFSTMGIDLYGKFFLTNGERFRPYVGAGLGYNRSKMRYSENDPYQASGYNTFGDEQYNTSYATGNLMMGTEVMITQGVGLNIEAAYSTGLGDSLSSKSAKNPFNSPDQRRLRDLGEEIINSNALSIFAGAVVYF